MERSHKVRRIYVSHVHQVNLHFGHVSHYWRSRFSTLQKHSKDWFDEIKVATKKPISKIIYRNSKCGNSKFQSHASPSVVYNQESHEIKPCKIPSQNIVHHLMYREMNRGKPGTSYHVARKFYTIVFPNYTIVNIDKPPCFLRKFSPDGQHFIAFSSDQTSLEIYEFQGPSAAEDLLVGVKGDIGGHDSESQNIRNLNLFERFFKLKHTIGIATNGESLNRECSLFTDDGKYVIVGSAVVLPEEPHPFFFDIYRNNESVSPNARTPLEEYSIHLVDLRKGLRCDYRKFKCDKIYLSHNQGIYLYQDILAVLSVQQQSIHIFKINDKDSCFTDVRCIGRFCLEDDQMHFDEYSWFTGLSNFVYKAYKETSINSLKHRIMVFLYHKAVQDCKEQNSNAPLLKYYSYFEQLVALRMWKMQLLDENHLLIKYASEETVTMKVSDGNAQTSFFCVYNMISTEVIGLYENTSEKLLDYFENMSDLFRNATLHNGTHFTSSPSSNVYAKQLLQRFKQTIINAKFGGQTEAVKRLLAQLPISAQSYSSSPYLDLSLFSYDDKWVSVMERPKACGDHPIRFYARNSGLLKFKIYAGLVSSNTPPTARRLVAFTFHPFEPFAISVQRTNAEYVVNFHIRHSSGRF